MAATIHRRSIAAIIAAVFLVATVLGNPGTVRAGAAYSTTGGCAGWGMTYIISADESYTKTDATTTGGCGNTYSSGYFYVGQSSRLPK